MSTARLAALIALSFASTAWAGPRFMIEIADTAAYRVTHDQLAELVPELGEVPSSHLRLSVAGETRQLYVEDGGDARFGPGDAITFFGERLHGPQSWYDTYAVHNVYTLEISDEPVVLPALQAAPAAAASADLRRKLHLEEENLQIRLSNRWVQPEDEPDLWHWAKLTHVDPQPFRAPFALPDLSTDGNVRVRLGFRGLSEIRRGFGQPEHPGVPDHKVEVRINGQFAAEAGFNQRNEHELEFELPAAALSAQDNQLELRVPRRSLPGHDDAIVDVVMFNYLNLDYPIAGQLDETPLPIHVSRPGTARLHVAASQSVRLYGREGQRIDGASEGSTWRFDNLSAGQYQPVADARYATPAQLRLASTVAWRDVEQGYDYLLVAHPDLMDASRPLAEHHRGNGLRVAEVDVLGLYDEFNHGVVHPRAIRDFIAHAYHQWPQPQPRFVLLVGDASFDIRSDRADDNRYAKWVGRELLIPGRFGVIPGGHYENTEKIGARRNLIPTWQYPSEEGHSASDNYFVAVDGDNWLPDLAIGRFPVVEPEEVAAIVDKTIAYATSMDFGDWRRRALFTTDTSQYFQRTSNEMASSLEAEGFLPSLVFAEQDASDNLPQINALNEALNQGQLLVHFIGHGGRYIWRTGPPDPKRNHDLFTLDHVANLDNAGRLPMVLSMTCYSAPFDHPSADSIGERFLREPDKGAIAVFAASWRNTPTPDFSEAAISELMHPGATIGEALMRAKHAVPGQWQRTLVETYNLLGDPAVVLQRPSLPLQLHARNGRHAPTIELAVDSPEPVNGHAMLEWLDKDGQLLATTRRELRGIRASFAPPPAARTASEVQIHLVDRRSRRDGVARLHLSDPHHDEAQLNASDAAHRQQHAENITGRSQPRRRVVDADDLIFTSGAVDTMEAAGLPPP